jgi:hypothetical protein
MLTMISYAHSVKRAVTRSQRGATRCVPRALVVGQGPKGERPRKAPEIFPATVGRASAGPDQARQPALDVGTTPIADFQAGAFQPLNSVGADFFLEKFSSASRPDSYARFACRAV